MPDRLSHDLASLRIDRSARTPHRGSLWRVVASVAAIGALAAGVVTLSPRVNTNWSKLEVETTEVSLVTPGQGAVDLTATGFVVPHIAPLKVTARFPARVDRVSVQEGAVVHKGDELFVLDAASRTGAIHSAEARIARARANAAAARAAASEVHTQLNRQKQLLASGAVAPATVEDLAGRARTLDAQTASADAEVQAAIADKRVMEVELKDMAIRSPLDGRAVTRPVAVGELATPDKVLVELVDFASLVVEVDVAEAKVEQVRKGMPAEIVLDAFPSKRMRGEVIAVNPRINRAKATGTVKVKFIEGSDVALPDMAARVSFLKEALNPAEMHATPKRIIPSGAVVDRNGQKFAFTVQDDRVRRVPVSLGPPLAGGYELLDGPSPGTRLVLSPPERLEEGAAVKLRAGR